MSGERGGIVAFVALAPLMLLMLAAFIQIGVLGHAHHVAALAADAGLSEASAFDGSTSDGQARAEAQLAQASGWVTASSVAVSRSDAAATVTVNVEAMSVFSLSLVDTSVTVTRSGPVDQVIVP